MFEEERHFDFFEYEFLTKDFCFMKPLSFRFTSIRQSCSCEYDQIVQFKSNRCTITEDIKLWKQFGLDKTLKISSSNHFLKLYYQYDLPPVVKAEQIGPQQTQQYPKITVYGAAHTDRKLQNASVQAGLIMKKTKSLLNANLTALLYEHKNDYFLYAKLLHFAQNYNIGFLSIFDFSSRNLQTNNLVLEVKPHPRHHLFLRAEVDGLRNYSMNYSRLYNYFDFLIANYLVKPTDSLSLMAEFKYDINSRKIKHIESLIEKRFPTRKLKLKINSLADLTLQFQFPLTFGQSSSFSFGVLLADLLKSRKISYGFRVHLNY